MALFPTLLLAMTLAYGQNVKISKDPFKSSPAINEIEWTEQPENNIVYCTSDRDDVVQMRFDCPDCNKTLSFDWYALSTDKTKDAGFPVLQLSNVPGYKVLNGKTLECEVQFGTENAQPNPQTGPSASRQRANAMMKVRYLDVPQIMSDNHPPVYLGAQIGNAFYLACTRDTRTGRCTPSQSLSLNCFADGNPRPNSFNWTGSGGQSIGVQQTVTSNKIGESVQCHVSNSNPGRPGVGGAQPGKVWKSSESVKIIAYEPAVFAGSNFKEVQRSKFKNGKVTINTQLQLSCTAAGNPPPQFFWMKEMDGKIYNTTCGTGQSNFNRQAPRQNPNSRQPAATNPYLTYVTNTCTLPISNYSAAGRVWCAVCSQVAKGRFQCERDHSLTSPSSDALRISVSGPPQFVPPYGATNKNQYAEILQRKEGKSATVRVVFCAEPMPRPPRDIVWKIDDLQVNIGEKKENYNARRAVANGTTPDCYRADLVIDPVKEDDKDKNFQLLLRNSLGEKRANFRLSDLLGSGEDEASSGGVALALILTFVILFIIIIIIVLLCWWRRLCCFAQRKRVPEESRYATNVAPEIYKSEPPPPRQVVAQNPYQNGAEKNGYPDGNRSREGFNYAELDLVPDNRPPPIPQTVDYTNLQPQYGSKPVTNSVV